MNCALALWWPSWSLQAAHRNRCGAALHIQRVLLDAVLRARLALAVLRVDAVAAAAPLGWACSPSSPRPARPPPAGAGAAARAPWTASPRPAWVVGVHLRRVVVLRAPVAGARRTVVHGVRAVAAGPWSVEVGAPGVVLRAQELALGLQAGAPVPKVQGQAVQPRGAEVHRPAGRGPARWVWGRPGKGLAALGSRFRGLRKLSPRAGALTLPGEGRARGDGWSQASRSDV